MKNQITVLSFLLILISCSKKQEVRSLPLDCQEIKSLPSGNQEAKPFSFDNFVFTSADSLYINSIKFSKSDTIYSQKRYPYPIENSYAILKPEEREKLSKLFDGIDFTKFDSIYTQEHLYDRQAYVLGISIADKRKRISLYGNKFPKELKTFIDSLGRIKEELKFLPTKKVVNFGGLEYLIPPPPPSSNPNTIGDKN